jgi:hypothetical protein
MENGDAYISQKKLAEKMGIERTALTKAISRKASFVTGWKLNEINQIHADSLPLVTGHYAQQGHREAAQFLMEIAQAGARAWVYHEAGYQINAKKAYDFEADDSLPKTHVSAVRAYLGALEVIEEQNEIIEHKKIITDDSVNYFPISKIKELYPDAKISGIKLSKTATKFNLPMDKMFASKGIIPIKTYHKKVWNATYPNITLK